MELEEFFKSILVVKNTICPGDWDRDKHSLALIACNKSGNGAVLFYVGGHIAEEIEEAGLCQLDDLGLDDAPEAGIWVWEGIYIWEKGGFECPEDGNTWPKGTWRRPTEEEWQALKENRCPWDESEWRVRAAP